VYDYTAGVRKFYDVGTKIVPVINAGQKLEVSLDWTPSPLQNGEHGCILVTINYGLDSDYSNSSNVAQRNLQIKPATSPARFIFRVENPLPDAALIHLEVEVEGGWTWTLSDNDFTLHPWEDCPRRVMLTAIPPAGAPPGDQAIFHVYAHATSEGGFDGVIGGVSAQAYIPQPTAAYVYLTDDMVAAQYAEMLAANGIVTTLIPLDAVPRTGFSDYDLILIGYDTGEEGAWDDDADVAAIQHSLAPILALGRGGNVFLGQLGLHTGYPNGSQGEARHVYALDPAHAIFREPNSIDVPGDQILELYIEDVPVIGIGLPEDPGDLNPLASDLDEVPAYPLIQEHARYFFWGFNGGPGLMTADGQALMGNIADYLLSVRPDVDTLILTNGTRMQNLGYSSTSVTTLDGRLSLLVNLPTSQTNMTAVIRDLTIDATPAIQTAYTAWNGHEGEVAPTNALVTAIDNYIESLKKGAYPNLKYVIFVGSHEVIPMGARGAAFDEYNWADVLPQKSGYLYDIYHTKDSNGPSGYFLTDAPYRDLSFAKTAPYWGGPTCAPDPAVLPELAVGRLMETPAQIAAGLDTYMQSYASIASSNLTSIGGPDLTRGAKQAAKYMGSGAQTLIQDSGFLSSAVLPLLNKGPSVLYFGGHAEQREIVTRKWDQSFMAGPHTTLADTTDVTTLQTTIMMAPGCHPGVNLGNKLYHAPDGTTTYTDFAEELAARQVGAFLGHTTYGLFSPVALAWGEKMGSDFVKHLVNDGFGTTVGEAHLAAIADFVSPPKLDPNMPPGRVCWSGSKEQTDTLLASLTLYGIPNYRWNPPMLTPKWEHKLGLLRVCPDCPLTPTIDQLTLIVNDWRIGEEGEVEIPGTDLLVEIDQPMLPVVPVPRVLPAGSQVAEVTWDPGASESIILEHDIPLGTASHVNRTMDGLVTYGAGEFEYDGFFPPEPVYGFSAPALGGGAAHVGAALFPVQYNPATGQIRIWTQLAVTVRYETDADALALDDDGDSLPNYWEAGYGLDPYNPDGQDGTDGDPDGDGLTNGEEFERGTNPRRPDSDYDGETDGDEVAASADPLDPRSRGCMSGADFNDDRQVDVADLQLIAGRWRRYLGDLLYTPMYDVNDDGRIDIRDIAWSAVRWGERCGD